MVFNVVFNGISVITLQTVHLYMLSWSSFNQYSAQFSFQAAFPHDHCQKNGGERGMNPVAMTTINPRTECRPSWGSNQGPPVLKSAKLLTELWGPAQFVVYKCFQFGMVRVK